MVATVSALFLGFDFSSFVKNIEIELLSRTLTIKAIINSKPVFDVVDKDFQAIERRLQIDVLSLC